LQEGLVVENVTGVAAEPEDIELLFQVELKLKLKAALLLQSVPVLHIQDLKDLKLTMVQILL
tara:strand:- start:431 stop:616 length:186 start_codon:yes stop_codon:yes gene_type:complete